MKEVQGADMFCGTQITTLTTTEYQDQGPQPDGTSVSHVCASFVSQGVAAIQKDESEETPIQHASKAAPSGCSKSREALSSSSSTNVRPLTYPAEIDNVMDIDNIGSSVIPMTVSIS